MLQGTRPLLEIAIVLSAVFIAQVTPGPNMMAVASASLGGGRKTGIVTSLGVSVGVFVWAVVFTTGGGAFIEAFPQSTVILQLMGGAYLLYLGVSAVWRAVSRNGTVTVIEGDETAEIKAFARGFLVVSTNPKAALVWIAVSAYLAPLALSGLQYLLFGVAVALSAALVFGSYAYLFSTSVAMRGYKRFFRSIEIALGGAFGLVGARLISEGLRDVRS